jgi:hypothetical protein
VTWAAFSSVDDGKRQEFVLNIKFVFLCKTNTSGAHDDIVTAITNIY